MLASASKATSCPPNQDAIRANQRTKVDIRRRRMEASVLLIKGLGGGSDTTSLPKFCGGSDYHRRGIFREARKLNLAKVLGHLRNERYEIQSREVVGGRV